MSRAAGKVGHTKNLRAVTRAASVSKSQRRDGLKNVENLKKRRTVYVRITSTENLRTSIAVIATVTLTLRATGKKTAVT